MFTDLAWPSNGKCSWRAYYCNIHLPIMWLSWLASCSCINTFTTSLFLTTIYVVLYMLKIFAVNLGYSVFFYIVSVPKSNSNGTVKFLGIYESYKILLSVWLDISSVLAKIFILITLSYTWFKGNHYQQHFTFWVKGKGQVHPRTDHEGLEGQERYSSALFLILVLDGVGGQSHAPATYSFVQEAR
jgi:hypothetical protein